jgi:hypothetical protein
MSLGWPYYSLFLHGHQLLVGVAQAQGQHLGNGLDQVARQTLVLFPEFSNCSRCST